MTPPRLRDFLIKVRDFLINFLFTKYYLRKKEESEQKEVKLDQKGGVASGDFQNCNTYAVTEVVYFSYILDQRCLDQRFSR